MRALTACLVILAALPGVAAADATVVARLRPGGHEEATIVIRDADGVVGSCDTRRGTCRMERIAGGRYYVSARAADGRETTPRPVLLPPDGEAQLIVAPP